MFFDPNVPLAICTADIVNFIRTVTTKLVQVPYNENDWANILNRNGIETICVDNYQAASKIPGDLLIVWPKDGTVISECIAGQARRIIILCGSDNRFINDLSYHGYRVVAWRQAYGRSTPSRVEIYFHETYDP